MNIPRVVDEFQVKGYEMILDGDDFIVWATRYPLIESQKAVLKKHKREIIMNLAISEPRVVN